MSISRFVDLQEIARKISRKMPGAVVITGAFCGLVGGLVIGAMAGLSGVVAGVTMGLGIGIIAGRVFEIDQRRSDHRTRQLDADIGITSGSMGAGRVSLVNTNEIESRASSEKWLSEWLTPPPPSVMSK